MDHGTLNLALALLQPGSSNPALHAANLRQVMTTPIELWHHPRMPETVSCPCGSAKPASRTIQARDADSGEAFTYLACPDCTLERLSPRPTAAEMGAYYPQSYAPHVGAPPFGRADRLKRLIYDVFWAPDIAVPAAVRRIRPLLRLALAPVRHRSVLAFAAPGVHRVFEFGAAKATDLLAFRAAGWEVAGCEPSAQACALAASQGVHLQQATAETAILPDGTYGCILFNNVFEHVHDPVAVLEKCRRALVPDGILILIVPNHACATARLFGAAWPGYDAPRHIWGWTPAAICRVFDAAHFKVEAIHQQATGAWMWRSTLDMRHAPGQPGLLRRFAARRLAPALVPLGIGAALFGSGDFIKVMARRIQ